MQSKQDRKRKKQPEQQPGANGDGGGMKRKSEKDTPEGGIEISAKRQRSDDEATVVAITSSTVVDVQPGTQSDENSSTAAGTTAERFEQDSATAPIEHVTNGPATGTVGESITPEWKPKFRILDALSATGLRALRYATEIPFATSIVANDMDRNATKSIRMNVEHNKLSNIVDVNTGNAIGHMYGVAYPPTNGHGPSHVNAKYDVIDLDPYGTAAPFIDAALQALNDGGLLCVTCTDSGVFASCGYAEKTYSLYGGMPIKGNHSHEGGLRIILHSIATAAARYGLAIEPLLSLSIDFYVRMFVRVTRSPADVKFLAGKTMLAYNCDAGCGAWHAQMLGRNVRQKGKASSKEQEKNPTFHFKHGIAQAPSADRLCEHCKSKMHVAGPMWGGPLHNAAFVEKILKDAKSADKEIYRTIPRVEGMLDTALDELVVLDDVWQGVSRQDDLPKTPPETVDNHPFFFIPSAISKVIHCQAPPEAAIKGALRHAGYRATRSHCKPGSVKTDAPWVAIWRIMREWARQRAPIKEGALREGQAGWRIMQVDGEEAEKPNGNTEQTGGAQDSPDIVTEKAHEAAGSPPADPKAFKVTFDEVLGKDKPGRKVVRYQQNPRENWGPMARAKGSARSS